MTVKREMQEQIEKMLKNGIIEPSTSAFASPVVMVPKKSGELRFAIDYHKLNAATIKQVYHIPLISEIRDEVAGKKNFSCFDFAQGFHQIPMENAHKERTVFSCFMGLFQFRKMPFGLCGAPITFTRAMYEIKQYLGSSFLIYIDDVILASESEKEHLSEIHQFFDIVKQFGMRLKLKKCLFGQKEIKYLGFLISEMVIKIDPRDIEPIEKIAAPKTLTELRSFIGTVNYFRRFIPGFAKLLGPLYEMTKDGKFRSPQNWTELEWNSFYEVKERLKSAPVLAPPNPNKPYEIETDASSHGVGAILIQDQHPIAFASRVLKDCETRYHINELEAMAIQYALSEFEPYIMGTGTTTIRTDNSAVVSLLTRKDLKGRLARFQLAIQAYDIKIQHRTGKSNWVADYLSRYVNMVTRGQKAKDQNDHYSAESEPDEVEENPSNGDNQNLLQEIIKAKRDTPELKQIFNGLKGNLSDNPLIRCKIEPKLEKFTILENALYRIDKRGHSN